MWVLEARKDAEKVWFPVVWEEKKDPSNVVDYDIHDEITKDTSNVVNANNDTTTGMATVIPWINAPKLIAETSIAWLPDVEQEWSYYGNYVASGTTPTASIDTWTRTDWLTYTMTEQSNSLPYSWAIDDKWVVFPRAWWYSVAIRYYSTGQEDFLRTDNVYLNDTVIDTTSSIWSSTTHTVQLNAKKWDVLRCKSKIYSSIPRTTTKSVTISYTITPK